MGRYDSKVCLLLPRNLTASEEASSSSVPVFLDKHLQKLLKTPTYPSCPVKQPQGWELIPGLARTAEFATGEVHFISASQREP